MMEQLKVAGVNYISNRTVSGVDAVMFDIDDTLIFTDGRPNGPIIDLLYIATLKGYKIVIITARAGIPRVIDFTVDQLKEYNIMYDYIGFTSPETKGIMKEKLPYNFVLSVGDMPTDLTASEHWLNISTFFHN
jgi:predicted HAD superfamily phosphohydrolase YqeG